MSRMALPVTPSKRAAYRSPISFTLPFSCARFGKSKAALSMRLRRRLVCRGTTSLRRKVSGLTGRTIILPRPDNGGIRPLLVGAGPFAGKLGEVFVLRRRAPFSTNQGLSLAAGPRLLVPVIAGYGVLYPPLSALSTPAPGKFSPPIAARARARSASRPARSRAASSGMAQTPRRSRMSSSAR